MKTNTLPQEHTPLSANATGSMHQPQTIESNPDFNDTYHYFPDFGI